MLLDKCSNIAWRPDMPEQKRLTKQDDDKPANMPLAFFACPNSDCADFNHFNAGNISIAEWMGKDKSIRRLYCKTCGARFSERQGSLMQDTKLPQADVVRIIKCLGHGCSVEATADICEVDTRTVQRLLENSGKRAADFHRLQLEKLEKPLEAVQMDELHGKTVKNKCDIELVNIPRMLRKRLGKKRARRGFIRLWQ
jgi:transposase-like protein